MPGAYITTGVQPSAPSVRRASIAAPFSPSQSPITSSVCSPSTGDAFRRVALPSTRTGQPGLWFTAGAFSQCRIYGKFLALQIAIGERVRQMREQGGDAELMQRFEYALELLRDGNMEEAIRCVGGAI